MRWLSDEMTVWVVDECAPWPASVTVLGAVQRCPGLVFLLTHLRLLFTVRPSAGGCRCLVTKSCPTLQPYEL